MSKGTKKIKTRNPMAGALRVFGRKVEEQPRRALRERAARKELREY